MQIKEVMIKINNKSAKELREFKHQTNKMNTDIRKHEESFSFSH